MSDALKFVPPRVAFVDPRTGMITREWFLFLQGLFLRVGGSLGSSTTDLSLSLFEDAGTSEVDSRLRSMDDAWQQAPAAQAGQTDEQALIAPAPIYLITTDPDLLPDIASLRAEVDTLRQQIQSLLQGTTP